MRNEARVTLLGVPDRPGVAAAVFSRVAARNVAMDMIVQNVGENGLAEISFTVFRDDLPTTLKAVEEATREVGAAGYNYDDNVSKVSVVGLGMATQPGVAQRMFQVLAEKGINILMISTSEIKISVLVDRDAAVDALRTVHEVFQLEVPPACESLEAAGVILAGRAASAAVNNTAEIVARMQGMEDLIIEGIALDESQARVTLVGVPDRPGLAAHVFEQVAAGGIVVDMIVQSVGREGHATLSFTMPQPDLEKGLTIAAGLAKRFNCGKPTSCPRVAKLAVSGTGMRSHTGVARRLFQCLADEGINVDMISTSEMQINVVVDGGQGQQAREALRRKFADVML